MNKINTSVVRSAASTAFYFKCNKKKRMLEWSDHTEKNDTLSILSEMNVYFERKINLVGYVYIGF